MQVFFPVGIIPLQFPSRRGELRNDSSLFQRILEPPAPVAFLPCGLGGAWALGAVQGGPSWVSGPVSGRSPAGLTQVSCVTSLASRIFLI